MSLSYASLRIAAHHLLVVNGSADTMEYSDVPSVDTIDRQLTVTFDLPELNVNDTCGRSWSCGCLRYEVCPGMELTTAMTRDFATVADTLTVRTLNGLAIAHFMQTI